ncbi:DUF4139 domain-containing protein [Fodinibius halophilus]|uniref:Mucoidy inhibitor MuiA family protein n=1 Tax=Fodinibius halophilus TaxID=1736908 RepID=A0A6M1T723_9BACT|nr:DUF4139 domain-containing protein [Fodinibius halophilus]NGP89909.1 mucoidy inhibitor MuiA family protein [Fodinibius halophilus]
MKMLLVVTTMFFSLFAHSGIESEVKRVKSTVDKVTVFRSGAEVSRTAMIELVPGVNKVVFTNLSSVLNEKSVTLTTDTPITILSLSKRKRKVHSTVQLDSLEKQLAKIEHKLKLKNAEKKVLDYELEILMENKKLKGDKGAISSSELQQTMDYFRERLSKIEKGKIALQQQVDQLRAQRRQLRNQMNKIKRQENRQLAEIVAEIKSDSEQNVSVNFSYFVSRAGWQPSYDVRVKDIASPMEMVYKANIRQSTGIDWKKAELTISSADPTFNSAIPLLKTDYVGFYTPVQSYAPRYKGKTDDALNLPDAGQLGISRVTGRVVDQESGKPLPGVNITTGSGATGTSTEQDGSFHISVPSDAKTLQFSFIGYSKKRIPIRRNMNVRLDHDIQGLNEVVVSGYAKDAQSARKAEKNIRPVKTTTASTQTSFSFTIKQPYTISGDGKSKTVAVKEYNLPADYRYYAVPKKREIAFLTARLTNWEELNLLPGQTNLYFGQTFVGQSTLSPQTAGDTLRFSLGKDEAISVERKQVKTFSEKNFFGRKVKETKAWELLIKNNKSQPIQLELVDQIPVSRNEEIAVSLHKHSQGLLEKATGQITWQLGLKPQETQKRQLRYTLEYPAKKTLEHN